ncbi:dethiobiotin synthase [Fulvivirga sp. RKSG066]|uniref:dethiobiotin synthase n=1 Tax=Fulvivirga aurantia TaxID=2529383 RepID=UPI0012BD72DE|nr:dethiobiotin synthase [Fulvivirga aurantia]MTI21369.1 dethiobiotin synthase [Fulvivirga aurantia]
MKYFVTAIGTDSGKTLASAIIAQALGADYWKPIQAGQPTDSDAVKRLTTSEVFVHKEAYLLNKPASPHDAAKAEKIEIDLKKIIPPNTEKPLVIEGAGGILVPLNDTDTVIDIASQLEAEVILVSNLYLGSINHTLLSIEALAHRKVKVKGIIFNGDSNPESENIILSKSGLPQLLHIKTESKITSDVIEHYSELFKRRWHELGY